MATIFNPDLWTAVPGFDFEDITYHRHIEQGTVRIAFDRPDCLNAFRPKPWMNCSRL
ncbi:naphthoate synthase [Vibrio sp. JCM 19236]|nr:naphthoate synthase [Vibrio sp. JCM 19236]